LFLEVHPEPEKALSDAACMLPLSAVEPLLEKAQRIRAVVLSQ
jgi:2-dehydro-3-deoxyphosphooctonate aldolase (KDO 8-P synthase)